MNSVTDLTFGGSNFVIYKFFIMEKLSNESYFVHDKYTHNENLEISKSFKIISRPIFRADSESGIRFPVPSIFSPQFEKWS